MKKEEVSTMMQFVKDNTIASNPNLNQNVVNMLRVLNGEYSEIAMYKGSIVLTISMSMNFGNISIQNVDEIERPYTGPNSYISVSGNSNCIYFGDKNKEGTEPYDRQGVQYVPYRWSDLKLAAEMDECDVYVTEPYNTNISFRFQEFMFNEYWNTVSFSIVVSHKNKDDYISKLVKLLQYVEE